eukprot:791824-Pyramimonas_sp.AAC.1
MAWIFPEGVATVGVDPRVACKFGLAAMPLFREVRAGGGTLGVIVPRYAARALMCRELLAVFPG